jgi:acetyl-CoA synthetase
MTEDRKFVPPASIAAKAHIGSMKQYQQMWEQSVNDPDKFWLEQAKWLTWLSSH